MSSTLTDLTAATTWSGTDLFYALVGGNSRKIAASSFLVGEATDILSAVRSTNVQTFRVYRTFTDSSNYERLAFSSISQVFTITAETAGTGNDAIHIALEPAGQTWVYTSKGIRCMGGSHIDAGIGYSTGAGGAVTQTGSKSTTVTLNRMCGQVTTHNESVAAGDSRTFQVSCNVINSTDVVVAMYISGGTAGGYRVVPGEIGSGSHFKLTVTNISVGALGEAILINYAIFKGANA